MRAYFEDIEHLSKDESDLNITRDLLGEAYAREKFTFADLIALIASIGPLQHQISSYVTLSLAETNDMKYLLGEETEKAILKFHSSNCFGLDQKVLPHAEVPAFKCEYLAIDLTENKDEIEELTTFRQAMREQLVSAKLKKDADVREGKDRTLWAELRKVDPEKGCNRKQLAALWLLNPDLEVRYKKLKIGFTHHAFIKWSPPPGCTHECKSGNERQSMYEKYLTKYLAEREIPIERGPCEHKNLLNCILRSVGEAACASHL